MTRGDLLELSRREPIDGTEISWWRLLVHNDDIKEKRAVYYVNTPWREHPWSGPDGVSIGGVAFVGQWAVEERYRGGEWSPTGRICGWADFLVNLAEDTTVYLSASDAEAELQQRIHDKLERMREQCARLEEWLALLEVAPWPQLRAVPLVHNPATKGDPL